MATLAKAIAIAAEAHTGAIDKGGAPYVLHPLRMMQRMDTDEERIVAVLHDVVEDSEGRWTLERLRSEGFSDAIVTAVDGVTHRPEEKDDYMAFIRRAAANPISRKVKLADLEDNMDLRRIINLEQRDLDRLVRYHGAWTWLKANSGAANEDRTG